MATVTRRRRYTLQGTIDRMSISGMRELDDFIKRFPPAVLRVAVRKASQRAMRTTVLPDAKARAPRRFGILVKSLGWKQKTFARAGVVVTMVGPRVGFKRSIKRVVTIKGKAGRNAQGRFTKGSVSTRTAEQHVNPVNYAHFPEKGTRPHSISRDASMRKARTGVGPHKVWHPGAKAKPFLVPALEQNKGSIVRIYQQEMARETERLARQYAAKGV